MPPPLSFQVFVIGALYVYTRTVYRQLSEKPVEPESPDSEYEDDPKTLAKRKFRARFEAETKWFGDLSTNTRLDYHLRVLNDTLVFLQEQKYDVDSDVVKPLAYEINRAIWNGEAELELSKLYDEALIAKMKEIENAVREKDDFKVILSLHQATRMTRNPGRARETCLSMLPVNIGDLLQFTYKAQEAHFAYHYNS